MRFQALENGHITPSLEGRQEFAYDLRKTVSRQMFNGQEKIQVLFAGSNMQITLPQYTQFLDFATIERGAQGTLAITFKMPIVTSPEGGYIEIGPLNYVPPDR